MKEFSRGGIISYKVHRSKSEREFSQAISMYCIIRHLKTAKHLLYKEQMTLQADHNLIISQHITELLLHSRSKFTEQDDKTSRLLPGGK